MPVMVNMSFVRGLLVSENESSCRGMRNESLHCDKDMIWDKADFEVCKVWGSFSPAFSPDLLVFGLFKTGAGRGSEAVLHPCHGSFTNIRLFGDNYVFNYER